MFAKVDKSLQLFISGGGDIDSKAKKAHLLLVGYLRHLGIERPSS